jgi:hypothetical protein
VHAIDFLNAEPLDQSVLDHGERAGGALLRRLENDDRGAGKVTRLGEISGGAQQHRGVPVMAAGMHLAGNGRLVRQARFLLERQRVHVSAQPNDAPIFRQFMLGGGYARQTSCRIIVPFFAKFGNRFVPAAASLSRMRDYPQGSLES